MIRKAILFLGNTYIATIEELHEVIEKNYNGRDGKAFRKELLAFYKDGMLAEWLEEHNYVKEKLQLSSWKNASEAPDNEVFKMVYQVLTGKECTADLDSAFSQKAVLLRCEVNGKPTIPEDNTFTISPNEVQELKFVFKALEEIDSKMVFGLEKMNSRQAPLKAESELGWYAAGSEFSVVFKLGKQQCDDSFILKFNSSKQETVCKLDVLSNTTEIELKDGWRLKLFYFKNEDKKNGFWITEPYADARLSIFPNWHNSAVVSAIDIMRELNKKAHPMEFRLAKRKEIDTVLKSGTYPAKNVYFPIDDQNYTYFYNGKEKVEYPVSHCFVAVLSSGNPFK
jgi:hypothetical protein